MKGVIVFKRITFFLRCVRFPTRTFVLSNGNGKLEHRNMPVEDAFDLLASSYRSYQQQQAKGGSAGRAVEPAGEPRAGLGRSLVTDVHPTNIQVLINALQENRPLSVLEYDRVIRYLSERRDRQAAEEPRGLAGTTSQPPYQSESRSALPCHVVPHN